MNTFEHLRILWNGNPSIKKQGGGCMMGTIAFITAMIFLNATLYILRWPRPVQFVGWGLLCVAFVVAIVFIRAIVFSVARLGIKRLFVRLLAVYLVVLIIIGLIVPTQEKGFPHWLSTVRNVSNWVLDSVYELGYAVINIPTDIRFAIDGNRSPQQVPGIVWDEDIPPTPILAGFNREVPTQPPLQDENIGLHVGDSVRIVGIGDATLRVRKTPSLNSEVIMGFPSGTILLIIDGSESADGYVWWKVRSSDGKEGWCVENFLRSTRIP